MADPTDPAISAVPSAAPPVPATEPVATPVQADPAAAAAVAPAADQSPPQPAPAAGADSKAEPASPAAPVAEPTLLEKVIAERDAKPAEAKPGDKPADPKAAADEAAKAKAAADAAGAQPELPKIDYFKDVKVPESIKIDDAQRGDVSAALDLLRAGKSTEGVQKLLDLHNATMQAYATELSRLQWDAFADTRKGWRDKVMADPILGGAGHNTAMAAVARMRDLIVSSAPRGSAEYKAQAAEFDDMMRVTGAGDHPAFLRALHNVARYFDEPALPPEGARPPPNVGHPNGENRRGRMYPSMNKASG